MVKEIYNLKQLVKVAITDKSKSSGFRYQPFKKRFLLPDKIEGFVRSYDNVYTEEEVNNIRKTWSGDRFMIIDNEVFKRPRVDLYFTGGITHTEHFLTLKEAEEYGNKKAMMGIDLKLKVNFDKN